MKEGEDVGKAKRRRFPKDARGKFLIKWRELSYWQAVYLGGGGGERDTRVMII